MMSGVLRVTWHFCRSFCFIVTYASLNAWNGIRRTHFYNANVIMPECVGKCRSNSSSTHIYYLPSRDEQNMKIQVYFDVRPCRLLDIHISKERGMIILASRIRLYQICRQYDSLTSVTTYQSTRHDIPQHLNTQKRRPQNLQSQQTQLQ